MLIGWQCGILSAGHTSEQLKRSHRYPNVLFLKNKKSRGVGRKKREVWDKQEGYSTLLFYLKFPLVSSIKYGDSTYLGMSCSGLFLKKGLLGLKLSGQTVQSDRDENDYLNTRDHNLYLFSRLSAETGFVGGSEGPSNAARDCSLLWGKFSESMQRCEDKQENYRAWTKSREANISVKWCFFLVLHLSNNQWLKIAVARRI